MQCVATIDLMKFYYLCPPSIPNGRTHTKYKLPHFSCIPRIMGSMGWYPSMRCVEHALFVYSAVTAFYQSSALSTAFPIDYALVADFQRQQTVLPSNDAFINIRAWLAREFIFELILVAFSHFFFCDQHIHFSLLCTRRRCWSERVSIRKSK